MKKAFKFFILSLMTLIILSCSNAASEKTGKISVKLPNAKAARMANGFYNQDDAISYKLTVECTSNKNVEPVTADQDVEDGNIISVENLQPGTYTVTVEAYGETEVVGSGSITDVQVLPGIVVPVTISLTPKAATPPYTISAVYNLPYATNAADFNLENFTVTKVFPDGTKEIIDSTDSNLRFITSLQDKNTLFLGTDNARIVYQDTELQEMGFLFPTATVPVSVKASVSDISVYKGSVETSIVVSSKPNNSFQVYTSSGEKTEITVDSATAYLILVNINNPSESYVLKQEISISGGVATFDISKTAKPQATYYAYGNMYFKYNEYSDCFVSPVINVTEETLKNFIKMDSPVTNTTTVIDTPDFSGLKVTIEADEEILFYDENSGFYTYSSGTLKPGSTSDTYPTNFLINCFTLVDQDGKIINEGTSLAYPEGFGMEMIGEDIPLGLRYQNVAFYPEDENGNTITVDFHTRPKAPTVTITVDETTHKAKVSFQSGNTVPTLFSPEAGKFSSISLDLFYNYAIIDADGNTKEETTVGKFESKKENENYFEVDIYNFSTTDSIKVYAYCTNETYGRLIEGEPVTEIKELNNNPKGTN